MLTEREIIGHSAASKKYVLSSSAVLSGFSCRFFNEMVQTI